MSRTIFILNGPNLNLLGTREPGVYGATTLAQIEAQCREAAASRTLDVDFRQTNSEGTLIDWIQEARAAAGGIILNAAALTHTSIAVHDALKTADIPIVEVHLSNIYKRETFRHDSFVSPVADGIICGFGAHGYLLALEAISTMVKRAA